MPFINDKLLPEFLVSVLEVELKGNQVLLRIFDHSEVILALDTAAQSSRGLKELKDSSKLLVTQIVFEEFCALIARDWLSKLLEPVISVIYGSTPHAFANDDEENAKQTEHTAYTLADR